MMKAYRALQYKARDVLKGIRTIHSLKELDHAFAEAESAFRISSDAGLAKLAKIRFEFKIPLQYDPDSQQYREAVMEHYRFVSGRSTYDAFQAEVSQFDADAAIRRPYPYFTESHAQIGDQLMAQGFVLHQLSIPTRSRILEYGAGWGNLTLQLALAGHEVHVVEIDENMLSVLEKRSQLFAADLKLHRADMNTFKTEEKFDAVIFFESFHHNLNAAQLIRSVRDQLKDRGVLILAAEPITRFPAPWGLRGDGLSLWSTRKYGWLELGYDWYYLSDLLRRNGFSCERKSVPGFHICQVLVCQKNNSSM